MKTLKKKLILLFVIMMTIALSCGNSNIPHTESIVSEDAEAGNYDLLKNPIAPERIPEDLSGNVIVLSEKEFAERITALDNPKGFQYLGQTPCIVDLYASWCKPCGYLSQLLNELAPEYKGKVIFYKVDIDKAKEIAFAFNVKSIPMLLYFKPHGSISSTVGYLNREELKKAINDYLLTP
ncbi:MAG: thioredoxin family protein [Lentimicrobiaceae bacterium]|nr:thioredoxin family protein [Lentimicrobiaceae bacterium]